MDKKMNSVVAIFIIFLVAGGLTYIFWKGSSDIAMKEINPYEGMEMMNDKDTMNKESNEWRIFRNDSDGYEFKLPRDWNIEDSNGKFTTRDQSGEIMVAIESKSGQYSSEELLEAEKSVDPEREVEKLSQADGVRINDVEEGKVRETVKIVQNNDVIILTYLGLKETSNSILSDVIPTLRSIN